MHTLNALVPLVKSATKIPLSEVYRLQDCDENTKLQILLWFFFCFVFSY
jgi:hypothetical protein